MWYTIIIRMLHWCMLVPAAVELYSNFNTVKHNKFEHGSFKTRNSSNIIICFPADSLCFFVSTFSLNQYKVIPHSYRIIPLQLYKVSKEVWPTVALKKCLLISYKIKHRLEHASNTDIFFYFLNNHNIYTVQHVFLIKI